jgi:lipopolysaccharide transport system permease protein
MPLNKTVITARPDGLADYLKKIWKYRALTWVFAQRDLKVKYAQTFLGLSWTIVQPLTALAIFTFFFGYVLQWKTGVLPYTLYVLSGLLGWNFFSYIVFQGSFSAQESSNLIKKIYFPKIILPISKVYVALAELGVTLLLLIPLFFWYGQSLSWRVMFIPLVILFNILIALFVVLTIASLGYRRRDLFHLVPFLMNFGIWFTPVFFSKDILPGKISFIWYFNPMASVVDAWRWCLFPGYQFDVLSLPALLISIVLFIFGFLLYKKTESEFSDFV